MEDLKTLGAVETTLGLLDISLGSLLLKLNTSFKKEVFVTFITGVWTILTGLTLLCGGRKPSYFCMRFNVTFHLPTLMFSAVAFGTMVRHVPYRQTHCSSSCLSHDTMVMVNGILAILITAFLVETLISLGVILTGLCSLLSKDPEQPADPERIGSTTSEPLCLPSQQQVTPGDENMKLDS